MAHVTTPLFLTQVKNYKDFRLVVFCHQNEPVNDVGALIKQCKASCAASSVIVITDDYSVPVTKSLLKSGADDVLSSADGESTFFEAFRHYLHTSLAPPKKSKARNTIEKAALAATLPGMIMSGALSSLQEMRQNGIETVPHSLIGEAYRGLEVQFFGLFTAKYCGKTLSFPNQAEAIFAYLCYHYPKPQMADHLAKVFWPDKYDISPSRARRSLNVELTSIRNAFRAQTGFDVPFLVFKKGHYSLDFPNPICSDVQSFKRLYNDLNRASHNSDLTSRRDMLQELINTYPGNFLDNLAEDDAPSWVEIERQHLSSLFDQIAEAYIKRFYDEGDFGRAAAMCEELLSRDPRLESVYSCGMICYHQLGRGNKVRAMYDQYCRMMQREFESPPLPALTALYQKLISDVKA
ncbi:MAG TPA: bacterial transcriptional activator domain-containing protein [Saprospiraceae bacterium]|nr:bacterial transcriptional activator domain-containing protein [Saprospiraceae bacterium]